MEVERWKEESAVLGGMLSMSVFVQLSDLIRDERCIATDNNPHLPTTTTTIRTDTHTHTHQPNASIPSCFISYFSFTTLIHFSQLFQALLKVIIV